VQRAACDLTPWLTWSARDDGRRRDALRVTQADPERPSPFAKVTLSCTGSAEARG